MCGNYNGDINDDAMMPSGEINQNIVEYVSEWQTSTDCATPSSSGYNGACSRNSIYADETKLLCQKLRSGQHLVFYSYSGSIVHL